MHMQLPFCTHMCQGLPWSGHVGLRLLPSQDLQTRQRDAYACPRPLWHFIVDICAKCVAWAGLFSNVVWANWRSSGHRKSQQSHQPTLATYCLSIPKRGKRERTYPNKTWFYSFMIRRGADIPHSPTVKSIHLTQWIWNKEYLLDISLYPEHCIFFSELVSTSAQSCPASPLLSLAVAAGWSALVSLLGGCSGEDILLQRWSGCDLQPSTT